MACGCKKKKRGSGGKFLSGVTWSGYKPGSGMSFRGGGLKKKRRKRKRASGMSISGAGISFHGSGVIFSGAGFKRTVGIRRR